MGDSSASYIHMVQHLIEKCLIFHMSKEECIEALDKHANIKPVITSTVWNELEKENKEFFEAYSRSQSKDDRMSEAETSAMIQKMMSDPAQPKDPEIALRGERHGNLLGVCNDKLKSSKAVGAKVGDD